MRLFQGEGNEKIEVPELIICYKENSYLDTKDICINKNMPSCKRILFDTDEGKDSLHILLPLEKDRSNDLMAGTSEFSAPSPDYLKFCEAQVSQSPDNLVSLGNIIQTEVKVHKVAEDVVTSQILSKDQESATEILQQEASSEDTCNEDKQMSYEEPSMGAIMTGHALTAADKESINLDLAEESTKYYLSDLEEGISGGPSEDSNYTGPISGSSNDTDRVDSSDNRNHRNEVPNQNVPEVHDSQAASFGDQRGHGETSFSMAGPISGLITYSGPIAYSGSLSRRSDGSTTSTRSFAFPILQSEWHSSPVRMAKADRRCFWKRRGWRRGLLCCRF